MLIPRRRQIDEGIRAGDFTIDLTRNISGGFDLPRPDYVKELAAWREKCPRAQEPNHGNGHCERCDGSWKYPTGGAKWALRTDWFKDSAHRGGSDDAYPGQKFLQPVGDSGSVLPPMQDSGDKLAPPGRTSKSGNIYELPKQRFDYTVGGDEVADKMYENAQNNESLAIVCGTSDDTIKGTSGQRLSVQESPEMSDYIRDLLRMSSGGALGGREKLDIPSEIMDALAGDAAQEALSQSRVLEEMRRRRNSDRVGGEFVNLDLMMEMEKEDVDKFIKHARGKIMKRSKATRKGCCMRIGGVLDQLMGPGGDEYGDQQDASDRGAQDPIGEGAEPMQSSGQKYGSHWAKHTPDRGRTQANKVSARGANKARRASAKAEIDAELAEIQAKKSGQDQQDDGQVQQDDVEMNLIGFIAEEFALSEHSKDCPLRAALEQELSEQERWIQNSIKRPGSLRAHFGLRNGDAIPVEESVELFNKLQDKADSGRDLSLDESKLHRRLGAFLRARLSEAAHTGAVGDMNPACYSDAHKTRNDNSKYPTQLKPVAQGGGYDAGALTSAKGHGGERYMKGKDPIGEANFDRDAYDRSKRGLYRPEPKGDGNDLHAKLKKVAHQKGPSEKMLQHPSAAPQKRDPMNARGPSMAQRKVGIDRFPRVPNQQMSDVDYDGTQISETADALSRFMEAAHTGSVGDMNPTLYYGEKKTRGDNADYPTELKPAGQGGGYCAGKPKSRKSVDTHKKHRYDKGADPIGEAGDDVDYDGPQISETASALSSFMEAAKHTGAVGDMSLTPYWGETKTRPDNKEDFVKTGEDRVKGQRSKGDWDPANKGEAKPRYEKGADPVGGATPKQFKRP